jgi:hypothetical protein
VPPRAAASNSVLELTPDLEQRQLKVIRNGLRNSPAFDA